MRFADRLRKVLGMEYIRPADWDELADVLIEGDLGALLAEQAVSELQTLCAKEGITNGNAARHALKRVLSSYAVRVTITPKQGQHNVILLLGVNGVGKTSSAAKLSRHWMKQGSVHSCLLAACDTFRAAAIDQLKRHGERLGIRVVAQEQGSDAGAVLFDALQSAAAAGTELVVVDTAGRMHTKQNLINELSKLDKIVYGQLNSAYYKKLLVIDATTGQNALAQIEAFSEAVHVDGLILTKYDSSAQGGIALAAAKKFGIGTAFVCDGESYDAIHPFDVDTYIDTFLGLFV